MKKSILILFLLTSAFNLFAQKDYFIKEGPLKFTIPNDNWKVVPANKKSKVKSTTLLHFRRTITGDTLKRKVFPEIMVFIETVPAHTNLTPYSIAKQQPYKNLKNYKIQKVFTESDNMLHMLYAIGNKAVYEDDSNTKHTFYFIHSIKQNKGLQIIIDVPSELFELYEEEITSFIRSLE